MFLLLLRVAELLPSSSHFGCLLLLGSQHSDLCSQVLIRIIVTLCYEVGVLLSSALKSGNKVQGYHYLLQVTQPARGKVSLLRYLTSFKWKARNGGDLSTLSLPPGLNCASNNIILNHPLSCLFSSGYSPVSLYTCVPLTRASCSLCYVMLSYFAPNTSVNKV